MKYPKGEIIWVSYYNSHHDLVFIVTSKATREYYFLYEVIEGEFKKLGKSKNPIELEARFNVNERMSVRDA